MVRWKTLVCAACILWGLHAPAYAEPRHSETRGELLYSTHCSACHSEQIHWREKKLVTGWKSLVDEVRRWQASMGLLWSKEEIEDTARYLNSIYYRFPAGETNGSTGGY